MQGTDRPFFNPYLAVFIGVVASAFASIFTKLADAPPMIIAFYRLGFTVLILLPFTAFTGTRELRGISRRNLLLACAAGVMLATHFSVWMTSLNYTSIASSTVLVTMQPLFVVAGGYIFYKEKIGSRAMMGAGLALSGSIIVGISDFQVGGQALLGDLLAFTGAILVAGYVLIGRGLRTHMSLLPYVLLVFGSAAITLLLANLALGSLFWPYPQMTWVWFVALALVPTIMGHTVFNWALRYVNAAVVSVSILGEPVGATILAYFIFDQVPTMLQLAGGIVIITGLLIFIRSVAR